jgi:hypothetical protein
MRDRIAFQTNVPVSVALAYPDGIQVEGRFGDQIMYTLADERVMYAPPVVRSKLVERVSSPANSSPSARPNQRRATGGSSNGRLTRRATPATCRLRKHHR